MKMEVNNLLDYVIKYFPSDQMDKLDVLLGKIPSIYLMVGSGLTALIIQYIFRELSVETLFKAVRKLPGVRGIVAQELNKSLDDLKQDLSKQVKGRKFITELPNQGWNEDQLLQEIRELLDLGEFDVKTGGLSGTCHKPDDNVVKVVTAAYSLTAYTNPLNPDAFPGIRKMEAEVVRMTAKLFNGGDTAVGTMTSGGSESLLLATLAYRGYGRETKGITKPNMVMPDTGHVAFDKACHMFGVELRKVKVDHTTFKPSIAELKSAIDKNTIALVGSAPQYPHGIIDPITAMGQLALQMGIPFHVDSCLGGFLTVFAEEAGITLEPMDFRVAGVTSISADSHKFGYAPKGSSIILYSDTKYIHHQYYVNPDWTGGIFVSPTLAGSRSGGIVAATWAALMHHGKEGYVRATRAIFDTTEKLRKGIAGIPGLQVLGDPKVCVVAFNSRDFHIYRVADEMKNNGWLLDCVQSPTACHIYIVPSHTAPGIADNFLKDLASCVAIVAAQPDKLSGRAAVYGMAQKIPDRSLVSELGASFLDALYSTN